MAELQKAGDQAAGANATFSTTFTGSVPGGPCPVCHRTGNLVAHHGTYDPQGVRTLVHEDETGRHECPIPVADGWLFIGPDARWAYKPNSEITDQIRTLLEEQP